jgi:integrase/recombinase XerD
VLAVVRRQHDGRPRLQERAPVAARTVTASELTSGAAERFLAARRAAGYVLYLSPKALVPLLAYLRGTGAAPPPAPAAVTAVQALLDRYQRYLVSERGLTGH